jgi:hypothetical protein
LKSVIALVLFAATAAADPPIRLSPTVEPAAPPRLPLLDLRTEPPPVKLELARLPPVEAKPVKFPLLENIKISATKIQIAIRF